MDFAHYQSPKLLGSSSPITKKRGVSLESGTDFWRLSDISANLGWSTKSKIPDRLGFFRHMTTRLQGRQGSRARAKKQRRHFFVGRTTWKFCSGGDKMRNASGHQCKVKMSGSEKKVNENTYDISSIKRVTKRFLEVSRFSRAKQRQRNVQEKCTAHAKLLFAN